MGNTNEKHQISRQTFLRLAAITIVPGLILPKSVLSFQYIPINEDEAVKGNVAIARALTHQPTGEGGNLLPQDANYHIRRTQTITAIANQMYLSKPFDPGELETIAKGLKDYNPASPINFNYFSDHLKKMSEEFDKDTLNKLSSVGEFASFFLPKWVSKGTQLAASAFGLTSSFIPDDTIKIVSDNILPVVQALWHNSASRQVMPHEIKNILTKEFGIEFDLPIQINKNFLAKETQKYVDIYLNNKDKQAMDTEKELVKQFQQEIINSMASTVDGVVASVQKKRLEEAERQREIQYRSNEIQGRMYLASTIADKLIGPQAGRAVTVLGNSAIQLDNILLYFTRDKLVNLFYQKIEISKTSGFLNPPDDFG